MTGIADLSPEDLLDALHQAEAAGDVRQVQAIVAAVEAAARWQPLPHQIAPPGDWWMWVLRAGRGSGKTDAGAHYVDEHMKGPPCDPRAKGGHSGAIVGPTLGDAVGACVNGVSGIRAHNAEVEKVNRKEGTFAIWPNGAEAVVLGANTEPDADRLRAQGGNKCLWWFDEAAIARHLKLATDNIAMGGRLGARPHGIATSTPKPFAAFRRLMAMPNVVTTTATSYDNPHLPAFYREIIAQYEGTRWGRQEIHAELLDDDESALWDRKVIDEHRVMEFPPDALERVTRLGIVRSTVGVDPSTWDPDLGDDPGTIGEGLETGIVTVGIDAQSPPHVYVLEDASMRATSERWGRTVIDEWRRWGTSHVTPEANLGGMVLGTLRSIEPTVPLYREGKRVGIRAKQGKRARAEPVATLYQQGRVHHVGVFPALEGQMCGWSQNESWSPDRIDALVYAVTALAPWAAGGAGSSSASSLLAAGSLTRRR